MKRYVLFIILFIWSALCFAGDKEIINAMQTEIQRAMSNLRIEKMETPYFISLRFRENNYVIFYYNFGSFIEKIENKNRVVQALVRVNKPEMDNSNYAEKFGENSWNIVESSLPLEDDVLALRQIFWKAIDDAYKSSLQVFSDKKAYLQQHPQEDYPIDFLPIEEKIELILQPEAITDNDFIQSYIKDLSSFLRDYSFLTEGLVYGGVNNVVQYYIDSEGNRHKRPDSYIYVNVKLSAYTEDWYNIKRSINWAGRSIENLPKVYEAKENIKLILNDMQLILDQKPLEEYNGPVVFVGEASAKFFFDLLGKGISEVREPLGIEKSLFRFFSRDKGFLSKKINQRILPSSFNVWDKPNLKEIDNKLLIGYMPVDDEGIKSKEIQIVKEGKIIAFPMRRTAMKKYAEANGHARSSYFSIPDSYITNLIIEDVNGLSEEEFLKKINEIAVQEGLEEILMITKLKSDEDAPEDMLEMFGSGAEGNYLSMPQVMYIYNIKTNEKKPVWGLKFSKVNEGSLKNIVGSLKLPTLFQYYPSSTMGPVPISIYCPSGIIIEELNLVKTKKQMTMSFPLPMPELKKVK